MAIQHEVRPMTVRPARGEVSDARLAWSRALRIISATLLGVAVLIGVISYLQLVVYFRPSAELEQFTLIVGDWFPSLWDLEIAAIAAGIAAMVVASGLAPPSANRRWRVARIISISALTILVVLSVPVTAIAAGLLHSKPSVLPEQSVAGCRILVIERSFLLAGGGSVGIVQPGSVVVDWVRGYTADDGFMPFSAGAYDLRWDGRTADLDIEGSSATPVWWTTDGPLICDR
jgi:hypothetical protein